MAEREPQAPFPGPSAELGEHPRERPCDPVGAVLVELLRVDAADVVGLEDARVEASSAPANASFRHAVGVLEALGQHPHLADDRHEVRVALPARHDVDVDVVGDAGARDLPRLAPTLNPSGR